VRVGSARLTERVVVADPPTAGEVAQLRAAAREMLAEARRPRAGGRQGTASNLLQVLPAASLDRILAQSPDRR
jgi:exopolyphosphatase/pppGpp-phosphohydrolase